MLAERIDAICPGMPLEIRRWFLDPDYGKPSVQNQDWDLTLAVWDYVPLLIDYSEDQTNPLEKRFEAFSALMVLQSFGARESEADSMSRLHREIARIVVADRGFAHKVCECLGVVEALVVKKILGEGVPHDVPEWIRAEIDRRA